MEIRYPQDLVLVIDTSKSMEGEKLEAVKQAAKNLMSQRLQDTPQTETRQLDNQVSDRFAIVSFGDEATLLTPLTADQPLLNQSLDQLVADGGTRMDLGLDLAIQEFQSQTNIRRQETEAPNNQHILLFSDGEPGGQILPQDIVLVIDTSESMAEGGKFLEVKQAAIEFIDRQDLSTNRLAILGFGSEVQTAMTLTQDKTRLKQAVEQLTLGGGTRIDLALETALQQLTNRVNEPHILLFTDGKPGLAQSPKAIVLLLDRSTSMSGSFWNFGRTSPLQEVKQAALNFVQRQDLTQNQIGVISFGSDTTLESPLTSDLASLQQAISRISIDGGTNMSVGLSAAMAQLATSSLEPNIILFTDGQPNSSSNTLAVSQQLRDQAIRLIAIGTGGADINFLNQLTNDVFFANAGDIDQAFEQADTVLSGTNLEDALAQTLGVSQIVQEQGVNIVAVGTGDADLSFLQQLTSDPSLAFFTNTGSFSDTFEQAEKQIAGEDLEQAITDTLVRGQQARNQNINLLAVGTGDAKEDFLASLTDDQGLVFYVNVGDINEAFANATQIIYPTSVFVDADQGPLTQNQSTPSPLPPNQTSQVDLNYALLRIGIWTAILALGMSLALIVAQNLYLRRRILSMGQFSSGTIGSLIAGTVAGATGQLAFFHIQPLLLPYPLLLTLTPALGWTLLGLLLGGGMSFFIPNLQKHRGMLGGSMGGILGGVSFIGLVKSLDGLVLLGTPGAGAIVGRLAGATIVGLCVGLMIALLEILQNRKLIVYWTPTETTEIALGPKPILLGSSPETHVRLSRNSQNQKYPAIVAKIFEHDQKIIMSYDNAMLQWGMKKLNHELKQGDKRKFGNIQIEISS
jgi:Mg-chelatase subunit ChlD